MTLFEQLSACRFLPVVTAENVDATVLLASALAKGGMAGIEITLRTPAALDCIAAVKAQHPGMLVAAGTVLTPKQADAAVAAGADFCVSPGISSEMLAHTAGNQLGWLPGVATASEVMLGVNGGLTLFKLFPAVAAGGLATLKSLAGPFPDVRFCPTGGLNRDNFREFLALDNVIACGGSWMVAPDLVRERKWEAIEKLAREALAAT
ncbi:MAG: bifunctional 4-hydroxy-2-oxoglutarate aldolase/2-dehydro-3-deoxy-phosphogluconate aldolase [Halioglobus sp.]